MKRYLVLALAAIALAIAAPSAFATRVIFDPPSGVGPPTGTDCTIDAGGINNYTPCDVSKLDTTYFVEFVDCTSLSPGLKDPSGNAYSGWCLYMTNATGRALSKFTFKFTAPTPADSYDDSDELHCSSEPPGFASNNCQDGTTIAAGDVLDLSFFAPVPNRVAFYLITDFENSPGYAEVTVSVPEPGSLGLFGLGLLALGMGFGWQRRRQMPRSNPAA